MSNDAEHLEALLAEYVDGQLDASSAQLVEEHLAKNPATRAAVAQMKLDREAVRFLPRVTAPADMSEDLRGRLERDLLLNIDPVGAQKSRRFSPPMAAIAAMLVVCLGLASIGYVLLGNRPKPFLDVAIREPASTTSASPELAKADGDESKEKSRSDGEVMPGMAMKDSRAKATQSQSMAFPPPQEETAAQPMASVAAAPTPSVSEETPANVSAEKVESPAPPMGAIDAAVAQTGGLPGGEPARAEATGGSAMSQRQVIAVSDQMLPADAAAAIVGRSLDPARRSIVVVVDSSHVVDAFEIVSRFADSDAHGLELADQATTSRSAAKMTTEGATLPPADLAAIARGLPESSVSSIQSELRQVDTAEAAAFEITPAQTSLDFQRGPLDRAATTHPTTIASAVAVNPATTLPAAMPATAPAFGEMKPGDAGQLIDLYVVVRQATPATQPASQPTTQLVK